MTKHALSHDFPALDVAINFSIHHVYESVFAFFDSSRFEEAKAALALFKADMPHESKEHRLYEAEAARKVSHRLEIL